MRYASYLSKKEISENVISAASSSESQPVKDGCLAVKPRLALISCLQTDYHVRAKITGITK